MVALRVLPLSALSTATGGFPTGVSHGTLDDDAITVAALSAPASLTAPALRAAFATLPRSPRIARTLAYALAADDAIAAPSRLHESSRATNAQTVAAALVFEPFDGGRLHELLLRGVDGVPLSAAIRLGAGVAGARGLAALHASPRACLVSGSFSLCSIGFVVLGVGQPQLYAKLEGVMPVGITLHDDGGLATPARPSASDDVLALGVVLCELLTGTALGSVVDAAAATADACWPAPAAAALRAVADTCLHPDPAARPSAADIADALELLWPLCAEPPARLLLVRCVSCGALFPAPSTATCDAAHATCGGCVQVLVDAQLREGGKIAPLCCAVDCDAPPLNVEALCATTLDAASARALRQAVRFARFDAEAAKRDADAATASAIARAAAATLASRSGSGADGGGGAAAGAAGGEPAATPPPTTEERVQLRRLLIIERDLTLRCPRCSTAFFDYSNCNALTCGSCGCGFCALCLRDCGYDAHSHHFVAHPQTSIFDYDAFISAHVVRRTELVVAAVREAEAQEGKEFALALVAALAVADLRDLGISEARVLEGAGFRPPVLSPPAASGGGARGRGWW